MAEERVRYSDADLEEFRKIIEEKIEKAEKDLSLIRESFINDRITEQMILRQHSKLLKKELKL